MTTQPLSQNPISNMLSESNALIEPTIIMAKFILSTSRVYSLEFNQDIQMKELKSMIERAAHLRKNSYGLLSEGKSYTQYNKEKVEDLFPGQKLITFTLELLNVEGTHDETEFVLQINMPCPDHEYKFLLYYCFDCGKSICSECFVHGAHKGHRIQDKCFYLLSSKYLVEKMFENWSQKPYEDFQISVNLNEYKNELNNKLFAELFKLLQQVQTKCNDLIDKYNQINEKSLNNIRDSIRDIKAYCIRALEDYKKAINIKDIVNNEELFIDFDNTYKELGIQQKERFKENLQKFQELNKSISILVKNMIDKINLKLRNALLTGLNDQQYEDIERQINLKLIKPVDKAQILNQISDKKNKIRHKMKERHTINNFNKLNNSKFKYPETEKGRHSTIHFHSSVNSGNDINNSLNKLDNNNMMQQSVNNSYDNIDLTHHNVIDINNSNNLASNGRTDRFQSFNDLIGNKMDKNNNMNINIGFDVNNYNTNSNLITPSENKILGSNNLSGFSSILKLNNKNNNPSNTQIIITEKNNNIIQTNNTQAPSSVNDDSNKSLSIMMNQKYDNPLLNINHNNNKNDIFFKGYNVNYPKDINVNISGLNEFNNNIHSNDAHIHNHNHNHVHDHLPNVFKAINEQKKKNIQKININESGNTGNIDVNSNIKNDNYANFSSMEGISPILENRTFNQNNSNQSNSSSINNYINNFNTATFVNNEKQKQEIPNPFVINNINGSSSKRKDISDNNDLNFIENKNLAIKINHPPSNINLSSPFSTINNTKVNQGNKDSNTNNNINIKEYNIIHYNNDDNMKNNAQTSSGEYNTQIQTNMNMNNINESNDSSMNNKSIQINLNANQNNNNNLVNAIAEKIISTKNELNDKVNISKNNKFSQITEESFESGSSINQKFIEKNEFDIQYYINKPFLLCPVPGTNKLKIITDDEKDESSISLFFPSEIGLTCFLEDCAYCNYDKKLYITGGKIKNDTTDSKNASISKKLFVIDLFQTTLDGKKSFIFELSPMTYPKIKHSMIAFDDKIYVVGGENTDTVERYDIKTNTWELLNPMLSCRSYPNLSIYEGFLYAFFGLNKDGYAKSIERLNLTNPESIGWEMVMFDNPNNVDVRIYGCGLFQIDELIYFFGGKCMGQNTDEIFFVNMKQRLIDRSDAKLKWKDCFRENSLVKIGKRLMQISDERYFGIYLNLIIE